MRYIVEWTVLVGLLWSTTLRAASATQPLIIEGGADAGPVLEFKIANIRHAMAYAPNPPYVKSGGDWTFFDCTLMKDPAATFTVGTKDLKQGSAMVEWARVVVFVPNRDAGDHFVSAFAKAFATPVPPTIRPQPLKPALMIVAVLGEKLAPDLTTDKPGNWTGSKWFVAEPGIDAEVFFNYDLVEGIGRFEEKDSDYRNDLAYFMAENFRDGPRLRRSAADDPNITENGPRLQMIGVVPGSKDCRVGFVDGSDWMWLAPLGAGGDLRLASLANLAHPSIVGHFDGYVTVVARDPQAKQLIVDERFADEPGTYSSSDKHQLWLVDRFSGQKARLAGAWDPFGSVESVSTDGRFIAISARQPSRPGMKNKTDVRYCYDLNTRAATEATASGVVLGWAGSSDQTVALVRQFEQSGPTWLRLGATTGKSDSVNDRDLPLRLQPGGSPNGQLKFTVHDGQYFQLSKPDGSPVGRFDFHEDDRHYANADAISWLDSRYLLLSGRYPAFIDSKNMKMNYMPDQLATANRYQFSNDFRRVWVETPDGIGVGRMVIPE